MRYAGIVQHGPFAGLRLPSQEHWGNPAPLFVGSYEEELHELIEEFIRQAPPRVVNVGCAEGYYAVGFARRLPDTEVYAFDIDERWQRVTRETARANDVAEQVHVAGVCSVTELDRLLVPGSLLFIDCEGCELELLCPELVSSLADSSVLVELHDFVDPGISAEILRRFRHTHSSRLVRVRERGPDRYPAVKGMARADQALAVFEGRPTEPHPMEWAVLRPLRASFERRDDPSSTAPVG